MYTHKAKKVSIVFVPYNKEGEGEVGQGIGGQEKGQQMRNNTDIIVTDEIEKKEEKNGSC
jgi:hypothetical protein